MRSADLERVRLLIAEVCAISGEGIREDVSLINYGLDSIRAIDLIVGIEDEYGVRISDDAAAQMKTLADVVDYVRARETP